MRIPLVCLALLAFASPVQAGSPFEAICERKDVLTFRYNVDILGKPKNYGWNDTEKFSGGPWVFKYDGKSLLIDGKPGAIIEAADGVMAVGQGSGTASAAGSWTYVIHTGFRMIVASQVHGFVFGDGGEIKARAVLLDCLFNSIE